MTIKLIKRKWFQKIIAILLLMGIWQIVSMQVRSTILLPTPWQTLNTLIGLMGTAEFYRVLGTSLLRVMIGFGIAVPVGILLAIAGVRKGLVYEFVQLLMRLVKSIPVASFVILILLWVKSSQLSVVISFLIVLPMIYENVTAGIHHVDRKLVEMGTVFRMAFQNKVRYIYLPAVKPHLLSACTVGLGYCWKAGIAAEVIGLPSHTVGAKLYEAKLYLMTPELFAWTVALLIVSFGFEKITIFGMKTLLK